MNYLYFFNTHIKLAVGSSNVCNLKSLCNSYSELLYPNIFSILTIISQFFGSFARNYATQYSFSNWILLPSLDYFCVHPASQQSSLLSTISNSVWLEWNDLENREFHFFAQSILNGLQLQFQSRFHTETRSQLAYCVQQQ